MRLRHAILAASLILCLSLCSCTFSRRSSSWGPDRIYYAPLEDVTAGPQNIPAARPTKPHE